MKVLVKVECKEGKTLGYQPFDMEWVFTKFDGLKEAVLDNCHNGLSVLERFKNKPELKEKGLFSVKTCGESIELDGGVRQEVNIVSEISYIHLLEGQTAYLLNPETGKTIDIIRYDDL